MSPSHVAVLVPSVRKATEYLSQFGYEIGEEETFEETKEIYIQGEAQNPLLLMEPKQSGSYRRALEKRGPGIHHLAIDVLDLGKFLDSLKGSGWLLHLNSLNSIPGHKTAYLARPGFPALIEVQEKKILGEGSLFVETVELNLKPEHAALIKSVGLERLLVPAAADPLITIRGKRFELKNLF